MLHRPDRQIVLTKRTIEFIDFLSVAMSRADFYRYELFTKNHAASIILLRVAA